MCKWANKIDFNEQSNERVSEQHRNEWMKKDEWMSLVYVM